MKQNRNKLRTAIFALSASIVLPTAPVFGQDAPVIAAPPPVISAPPPVVARPAPPVATAAPPPRVETPPAATPTPAARAPARTAARRPATANRAPAPAPAPAPQAPTDVAPAPAPAPVAEAPLPASETPVAPVETARSGNGEVESGGSILPWLLIGGALLLIAGPFLMRRRRTEDDVYEEAYEPADETPVEPAIARAAPVEPAPVPAPVIAAAPAFVTVPGATAAAAASEPVREVEEPEVVAADDADVEALAAGSAPVADRPWLEFLMRPVRAGTSQDDAIVQFELTVGNTGSVEARDVRISTWMVASGSGTAHERSLIEVPADAQVSEFDIGAGDGARVEGELAIARGTDEQGMLPVIVAEARYALPGGGEGRTHAAFQIGLPDADGAEGALAPFPADRTSGLRENVEARLHGEPERV